MITDDRIQPEVDDDEDEDMEASWCLQIQKAFIHERGRFISDIITENEERLRRLKVKKLIAEVIEYTRGY